MSDCCSNKACELERIAQQRDQRRVLMTVLILNAAMFVVEFGAGLIAGSAALMADSVDMLGDAAVYGLSLYALARSAQWKTGAALVKSGFIMVLGVGVVFEAGVHAVEGAPPSSFLMTVFGALALCVNAGCLAMLWRFRKLDINMASTFECSRNDVIANIGVLAAAGGVALFASPWPDIIVGLILAAMFFRSSLKVLGRAWPAYRRATAG